MNATPHHSPPQSPAGSATCGRQRCAPQTRRAQHCCPQVTPPGRGAWWILGAPALALAATLVLVVAGAPGDWIGAIWLFAVLWTIAASLVQALRAGVRHGDWSAFTSCEACTALPGTCARRRWASIGQPAPGRSRTCASSGRSRGADARRRTGHLEDRDRTDFPGLIPRRRIVNSAPGQFFRAALSRAIRRPARHIRRPASGASVGRLVACGAVDPTRRANRRPAGPPPAPVAPSAGSFWTRQPRGLRVHGGFR